MSMISINGVAIADPSSFSVTIQDFDSENSSRANTADGKMFRERITTKRKLSLSFPPLSMLEISTILKAISPVFVNVTFPDPLTGMTQTLSFYAGDKSSPAYSCINGVVRWEGLSFDLIEQ